MTALDLPLPARAAAQRLRLIQHRWPAVAQLARLLSLAVRIEPSLLRAARLAARLDAAAEADLWFSGIIASSGTLGISFVPAVAEALRRELAASPDDRALAWNLIKEHHGQQPWSIRLEERINYLTTGPPSEASEIEDLLAAALSKLHEVRARDQQAALGIARWLFAALARAPAAARATPTAAAAELAAGVQLDGRLGGADQLAQAENSELLPWLLDHLGTTVLPVRLLPGAVALGGDHPDGIPLPVPVTDPLVVSVNWGSESGAHHEHVRVTPGEELLVPVEASEVELHTITGGGMILRRAGIGRIVIDGDDLGAGFAVANNVILTAAHVLIDSRRRHKTPDGEEPPDISAQPGSSQVQKATLQPPQAIFQPSPESNVGSGDDSRSSDVVPNVIYIPDGGEPLNASVVSTDTELDVALLQPEQPVSAILPLGQIEPGQQWRLQVSPGLDLRGSRQTADVPAARYRGVTTAGYPDPQFRLTESAGDLRGQSGAAITLENPWGAVIGVLLGEETPSSPEQVAAGRRGSLRVTTMDAIVATFNLARQITPATAALVDGKWPETQPLEALTGVGPDAKTPEEDDEGRARAAAEESERLSNAGRATEALASMQEAVSIYRSLAAASPERYTPDLGHSLSSLSEIFGHLEQNRDMLTAAEEAVSIFRTLTSAESSRYRPDLARSLYYLGVALQRLARHQEAVAAQEEAVAIFRQIGDRSAEASALDDLGMTLQRTGRYSEAIAAHEQAVAIFRDIGDRSAEEEALKNLRMAQAGRISSITVSFYDVKTRQSVEVPQSEVKKTKYERTTKEGKVQVRYALRGTYEGRNLTKFVGQADWEATNVPEV